MNEQSHSNKFSVHLSSIRTDWQSSSSKLRKLAKSSSSTALSLLRSSVEKIPSSNIWKQHEFITAGLQGFHLGWDHCHLVGFIWMHLVCLLLRDDDVRKQFFFFVAQWMKMRWLSPWQVSRGHLWQQLEMQSN